MAKAPKKQSAAGDSADALKAIAEALTVRPKLQIAVGIRNICGSTIGIPASNGEPDISLHPYSPYDPNSVATVSWLRWTQIRKSGVYNLGLLERFDDILDDTVQRGPVDNPQDCAPDHEKNKMVDPVAFIEQGTDAQIREKITGMTSENNLHRILSTVDRKVGELQTKFRTEGDRDPSRRALNELPVSYAHAERMAQWRLDQLTPQRPDELQSPTR